MKLNRSFPQSGRSFEKGAALISALAFAALLSTVLPLILSDAALEYASARHTLNQLRSTYNARSAAELSLLRILLYKEGAKSLGKNKSFALAAQGPLDMIWRAPVIHPLPVPEDLLESEKKEIRQMMEESFIRGSYSAQIQPEDGKADINDLSDSLESLQLFTRDVLLNLLLLAEEKERGFSEEEAVSALDGLTDWTDPDQNSLSGGSEKSLQGSPLPDRSFVTRQEARVAPGVTPEIHKALKNHITVYGSKGLNINYMSSSLLKALGLSDELTEEALARTQINSPLYSPFQTVTEFCEWLSERGGDLCDSIERHYGKAELLQFSSPLNFRIQATGQFKTSRSQTEILIYDANRTMDRRQAILQAEKDSRKAAPPPDQSGAASTEKKQAPLSPWRAPASLLIMYWKDGL